MAIGKCNKMESKLTLILLLLVLVEGKRRIYGGSKAKHREMLYQAAVASDVEDGYLVLCGGSVVHRSFVLSAAHCLERNHHLVVLVGSHELETSASYDVARMIVIDDWRNGSFDYDVALLQTREPMRYGSSVRPIRLPDPADAPPSPGAETWVAGYGLANDHQPSHQLRKVKMSIVSERWCRVHWRPEEMARVCAVSPHPRWGTCSGDSGGAMVHDGVIVGTLSYGSEDCSLTTPEVYTDIRKYTAWLTEVIDKYAGRPNTGAAFVREPMRYESKTVDEENGNEDGHGFKVNRKQHLKIDTKLRSLATRRPHLTTYNRKRTGRSHFRTRVHVIRTRGAVVVWL